MKAESVSTKGEGKTIHFNEHSNSGVRPRFEPPQRRADALRVEPQSHIEPTLEVFLGCMPVNLKGT